MPTVDVQIGKRTFQLSCEEGQEPRLKTLSSAISERMKDIGVFADTSNETVILAMAALMMQDELNEFNKSGAKKAGAPANEASPEDINDAVADAINTVAQYIEGITERFGKK